MSKRGYLAQVRFLIADHNSFSRHLIRSILLQFGAHDIHEAENGQEAKTAVLSSPPDIIITGWRMDPVDGMEFAHWLREGEDSPAPYTPIIMVTAYSSLTNVMRARDAGINEFLAKPISAKSLFRRIQAVIDHPRSYVRTNDFFGPDRRRRALPFRGGDRRIDASEVEDDDDEIVDLGASMNSAPL